MNDGDDDVFVLAGGRRGRRLHLAVGSRAGLSVGSSGLEEDEAVRVRLDFADLVFVVPNLVNLAFPLFEPNNLRKKKGSAH